MNNKTTIVIIISMTLTVVAFLYFAFGSLKSEKTYTQKEYNKAIAAYENVIDIYNETVPELYTEEQINNAIVKTYQTGLNTGIKFNRSDPDFDYNLKKVELDEIYKLTETLK